MKLHKDFNTSNTSENDNIFKETIRTDPLKFYLCYTSDKSSGMKYIGIFQGSDSDTHYSEICVDKIMIEYDDNTPPQLSHFANNSENLFNKQGYFETDIIFELTDDEVLEYIVMETI